MRSKLGAGIVIEVGGKQAGIEIAGDHRVQKRLNMKTLLHM